MGTSLEITHPVARLRCGRAGVGAHDPAHRATGAEECTPACLAISGTCRQGSSTPGHGLEGVG
jgi:hypothetical protein